ncbi:MAG: nucleotide sugar dehydrogenase [Thaumarchaeota archaeon]|nr:nucleotide sugar dehydrogenase [Nitrososphaerota archaeon]
MGRNTSIAYAIVQGRAKIGMFGLGFVGSSVAAAWLRAGAHIVGVDKNPAIIESIRKKKPIGGEKDVIDAFSRAYSKNLVEGTQDAVKASKSTLVKFITVPVGLDGSKADLRNLKDVLTSVGRGLKKGDTVVVKPTIPIATSEETIIPILEKESRLKVERDFYYVYSPERTSVGQAVKDIEENYPAILAGAGEKSASYGKQLYNIIAKKGVKVLTSLKAAEAEKIFEGIYRDVNIALANELAMVCENLGIDFSEVREAANSQPYSHIHKTGIGVGGACIPVYPWFIIGASDKIGFVPALTKEARLLNKTMPEYSVEKALSMVDYSKGSKVAVLGLSFRGGISDRRLSPTYDIVKALLKRGVKISVHDPFPQRDDNLPAGVMLTDDLGKALKGSSLAILATDHPEYRKLTEKELRKHEPRIETVFDGRGTLNPRSFSSIAYHAIGRVSLKTLRKIKAV